MLADSFARVAPGAVTNDTRMRIFGVLYVELELACGKNACHCSEPSADAGGPSSNLPATTMALRYASLCFCVYTMLLLMKYSTALYT